MEDYRFLTFAAFALSALLFVWTRPKRLYMLSVFVALYIVLSSFYRSHQTPGATYISERTYLILCALLCGSLVVLSVLPKKKAIPRPEHVDLG